MSDHQPPVHRNPDVLNVFPLIWDMPPTADEGMIDKAKVVIYGSVVFPDERQLRAWLDELTENPLIDDPNFLGHGNYLGPHAWKARIPDGRWTIGGDLTANISGCGARLTLTLNLNPSRTLIHLLFQYSRGEFPQLSGHQFFAAYPGAENINPSLDQRGNMVPGRHLPRSNWGKARLYTRFLWEYENALQRLIHEAIIPCPIGQRYLTFERSDIAFIDDGTGDSQTTARRGNFHIQWGRTALTECEVYWEYRVSRALLLMRRIADQALAAARDVRLRRYDTERELTVDRDAGSLIVTIPLDARRRDKRKTGLVIYAKDDSRIRIEVRYYTNLPDGISDEAGDCIDRLSSLFMAARRDAVERRLPWAKLSHIMEEAPPISAAELIPFVDVIREETANCPDAFRSALEALLLTGGVSEIAEGGWASPALIRRLVRRGVLEHVQLINLQRPPKRYRLTSKYQGLLALFRPRDDADLSP